MKVPHAGDATGEEVMEVMYPRCAGLDVCAPGTGKLKIAGGVEGPMRESINRAFAYLMGQKVKMGMSQQIDTTDFHVEAIDLLSNHVPSEAGIALVQPLKGVPRSPGKKRAWFARW
jgi:hypothetical protein